MLNKPITIFLLLVLASCANIVQPGGGPLDKDAPVVTEELPQNGKTGFNENTFTVCFDEYIQLKEPQKNVIISPPVAKPPQIDLSGKCIRVTFEKNQLQPNTTYNVQFLGTIADIHENTVLYDYAYIFSTGAQIDTLSLGGLVLDGRTMKKVSGYTVGLFRSYTDSSAFLNKPDYVAMSNPLGMYRFRALKEGTYRAIAFEDKNSNLLADAGEEVALSDRIYTTADSTPQVMRLLAFTQPLYSPGRLLDTIHPAAGRFELVYYKPEQEPVVKTPDIFSYHKKDETWDTLVIQQPNPVNEPFKVLVHAQGKQQEFTLQNTKTNIPELVIQQNTPPFFAGDTIRIFVSNQISRLLSDSFLLSTDSVFYPVKPIWKKNTSELLVPVDKRKLTSKNIRIRMGKGTVTDTNGQENKPAEWTIPVQSESDYGSIEFILKNSRKQQVLVQLLDEKFNVIYSFPAGNQDKLSLVHIKPGSYTVRGVFDTNGNNRWDGGNLSSGKQPERVFYLSTPIPLRADWLIEGNVIDFDSVKL
jgi:hypothetical protein